MSRWRPSPPLPESLEQEKTNLQNQKRKLASQIKALNQKLWAIDRGKFPPKTVEEAVAKISRRRDREWLMMVLGNLSKGISVEECTEDATRSCYPALRNRSIIVAAALSKMRQPDICQALEDVYAVSGFTLEDAVKTHIGHIKGEHTKQTVVDGEVMELRIPPSWAALAAYQKMVLPAQANKVQIEHSNMNEMLRTIDQEDGSLGHRTVGEIIDVEPAIDPDDIDPFGEDDTEEETE